MVTVARLVPTRVVPSITSGVRNIFSSSAAPLSPCFALWRSFSLSELTIAISEPEKKPFSTGRTGSRRARTAIPCQLSPRWLGVSDRLRLMRQARALLRPVSMARRRWPTPAHPGVGTLRVSDSLTRRRLMRSPLTSMTVKL